MDDDDEVLVVLAETLSTMLDYAGGPQHAEHVLRPLEKLCTIEETVVREKVMNSITMNLQFRLQKVLKKCLRWSG